MGVYCACKQCFDETEKVSLTRDLEGIHLGAYLTVSILSRSKASVLNIAQIFWSHDFLMMSRSNNARILQLFESL